LALAVEALGHDATEPRTLAADRLEVAVLDRNRTQPRKFRRFRGAQLRGLVDAALVSAAADRERAADPTDSPASDDALATTPAHVKPPLPQAPSGSDKSASIESLPPSTQPSDPSDVLGDDLPPDADDARGG
jgi:proteasome alpha subunit